ncbi:PQQ-dependent sugar dehydrogenase [Nocardioides albus]|uniref:Glucose/arabinose dehydrogenase n=1 Tax=Nocardioides albus TaxID=1841 RepID=A0A7W5A5I3_9ACTN|nr:PQQ-dependent sugar dehydrogenase [Nocardioides albus]MBB3089868.1 glucose/arabinose dehydrogenase [Nocardioides albus]GGU36204.1 glucose dehydrogenase [Nocardioides albus]
MRADMVLASVIALGLSTAACAGDSDPASTPPPLNPSGSASASPSASTSAPPALLPVSDRVPELDVEVVNDELDHPWDVADIGAGRFLVTERERAVLSLVKDGERREIPFGDSDIWVSGETGLMGLEIDPGFEETRRIYTCQGWNGGEDVRVISWTLDAGLTRASQERALIDGFPTSSGRHGGCRLLISADGALWVGTGDAANEENPRSLDSLGGKTLRLDPETGEPWPGNPWAGDQGPRRYITSFGHRNVQGLAQRADGTVWAIEHGPDRDDEVNEITLGGDYGWNPGSGYDESAPMTDQDLPGKQIEAAWASGNPTVATGGGTFIPVQDRWGAYGGALAVAVLKDQELRILAFDESGKLTDDRSPEVMQDHGRLRTVSLAADGDLLVTSDNGGGEDVLLRVTPR